MAHESLIEAIDSNMLMYNDESREWVQEEVRSSDCRGCTYVNTHFQRDLRDRARAGVWQSWYMFVCK